jgi:putative endonuclease
MDRQRVGAAGEDAVAAWYAAQGYEILDRNWRVRTGELDLVARRGRLVVVCEVKTRRSVAFGLPAEAVTTAKQRRLRVLAAQWLAQRGDGGAHLRFDVAAVVPDAAGGWAVEVIADAF